MRWRSTEDMAAWSRPPAPNEVHFVEVGPVQLKGFAQPVRLLEAAGHNV